MLTLLPCEYWDYRPDDVLRGLITAVRPQRPGTRQTIQIPALGPCFPTRSARAAIVLALKALKLPERAAVGVPLYCCPVVFKAIEAAGCKPRFIDVDPATYCLSLSDLAAKNSEVDAVIAVHMFGNVCDMPGVRRAAPGKPVIEDCAQALGSRLNGQVTGSFGDVAAFSFRSGKYLSVGEGGAVYCGKTDLQADLAESVSALPVPRRTDECVHVAATYLRSLLRGRVLWGPIGSRVWRVYNDRVAYTAKSPLVLGQMYQTDLAAVVKRLQLLDVWIDRQRSNAAYYSRNLTVDAGTVCSEAPGAFYNRLQYPLLAPGTRECDRLAGYLHEDGVDSGRPYKDIAETAAEHYGYARDCPQAERIARTVLVIPCNHSLKPADLERVASCVNRAWALIRSGRVHARRPDSVGVS